MVYYYQKVGEEGKSQLRVHYIDVTKDTDDSQYAPGDGVPATDPTSGQEMNPLTYTGNIGVAYDYAIKAKAPKGYVLVGTSPNIKGTFSKSDHDAYIYVKIDRHGAKATIENLTHLNNAQKQAAEAAIDKATDLNTMNQAKQDASTLDRAMGTLKQAITDGKATHGTVAYDEADPDKKSTLDNAIKNGQAVTDATNGSNADLTTVKDLSQAIENAQTGLNGDSNLANTKKQADQNIGQLTNLSDDQKKAAKDKITSANTSSDVTKAENDAKTLNDNLGKLNQGTDATKNKPVIPASKIPVGDQVTTVIITGDDYAYNDFYQVIIKANAVEVYTLPKGNLTKEKKLVHDTILTVLETKKIDGQVWYRIGTNRWIMAATTIKVGELENFKLKHLSKKTKTTAIVWVNKLAIYNNVNGKMTKKHLTRGTKVRIYAIATINGGEWYKIGKNKWIPAAGVHELTVEPL